MVYWKSLYEENATNAEIASGGTASETFFATNSAKQQIAKNNQSFNSLEINNDDNSIVIDIDLDGLSTRRRRLFAKGNLSISPEDGIYFNNIKVINTDGAVALAASKIKLNARMLVAVRER